jgi:hypothetical protein
MYESVEPRDAEKHWLVKWAEKNNKLIQTKAFMLPRLKDMTGWIVNETKNQGGQIEPRAAEMLKDMVGVDTRQAGMEIAKLLAYVNWARPVTSRRMWKRSASSRHSSRCSILSMRWRTGMANPHSIFCIACSRAKTRSPCGGWWCGSSVC